MIIFIELNKIYNIDCIEGLKQIETQSVDLIFADLPYGSTAPEWDKHIDINLLWEQYERIRKPDGIVALFAAQPFTTLLINSNLKNFRYCWYWVKNQGTNFFHATRMPIRKIEEICIFYKGLYNPQITDGHVPTNSAKGCSNGVAYFGENTRNYEGGKTTRYPTNILDFKCVDNYSRLHSAEKPVDLCQYIIRTYCQRGNLVLDNTCGAGSIPLAAHIEGCNYIGMDNGKCNNKKSKHYDQYWADIATERIAKYK